MQQNPIRPRKALLSVSNKQQLIPLAKALQAIDCEIISTGGTGRMLQEAGFEVTDISEMTGQPEAFGGRVKTISYEIAAALLFNREKDATEAEELKVHAIDLVVCNLYPFQEVLYTGANLDQLIEHIDIGGVTMIRAAAKNFKYVAVVTDTKDYAAIIEELETSGGTLTYATRKALMRKAFNHTADYDAAIATAMDKEQGSPSLRLTFDRQKKLRYGENNHQEAWMYRERDVLFSLYDMQLLHGKALSFNNILDIHGAIEAVSRHKEVACSVVKHSNPCGLAVGKDQRRVLEQAWAGDPISAFGSIIAFNRPLTKTTASFFQLDATKKADRKFIEVIIAPAYEPDALTYLQQHKNLRLIKFNTKLPNPHKDMRYMNGLLLVQDQDFHLYDKLEIVTEKTFDKNAWKDLISFGLHAISCVKSNAIILVRENEGACQLLGMGAGQPNRLVASQLAINKAKDNLAKEFRGNPAELSDYIRQELSKALLISDAFFPFADNVELAAEEGIQYIIQPGGSIRDKQVIERCNDLGVAMLLTGIRHFKH